MNENVKLDTYHTVNEDEFELEEIRLTFPGPAMLEQAAVELERQARIMRDLATLWKAQVTP